MRYIINNSKELYEFFMYTAVILGGIVVVYNLTPYHEGTRISEFLTTEMQVGTDMTSLNKVRISPTLFCGDGICQPYLGENVLSCPQDCFLP